MAAAHPAEKPFRPGSSNGFGDEDTVVRNWWAVAPSSTKRQIEPEQIEGRIETLCPKITPVTGFLAAYG